MPIAEVFLRITSFDTVIQGKMQYVTFLSRRNLKHKVQISDLSPVIEKQQIIITEWQTQLCFRFKVALLNETYLWDILKT